MTKASVARTKTVTVRCFIASIPFWLTYQVNRIALFWYRQVGREIAIVRRRNGHIENRRIG